MQKWLLAIGPMKPMCSSLELKLIRCLSAPVLLTLFKRKGVPEEEIERSLTFHRSEQVSSGYDEPDGNELEQRITSKP